MFYDIRLTRRLMSEEINGPDLAVCLFGMKVEVRSEDDLFIVNHPLLNGLIAGSGKTETEALEEFTNAFRALVDFHISEFTFDGFLVRHFPEAKTVNLRIEDKPTARLEEPISDFFPQAWAGGHPVPEHSALAG